MQKTLLNFSHKKNYFLIFLVLLFLFAFILRISRWSHFEHLAGDEGVQLILAEHFLKYGEIPLLGEISALDAESKYIIHNSPIGIYFLTLIYVLGFLTPEGYIFVAVILNLLITIILYKTSKILFNQKAASVTLFFALFSPLMLFIAPWPSQTTNALLFETLAIYLFSIFYKSAGDKYFTGAYVLSLIATQMYPPMYLLFIPKIGIFLYYLRKINNRTKVIILCLFSSVLIYLPLFFQEINYNWHNTSILYHYFSRSVTNAQYTHFVFRLLSNLQHAFTALSPLTENQTVFFFLLTIMSIFIFWNLFFYRIKLFPVLILLVFSVFPPLLVSLVIKDNFVTNRAYFFIVIPYIYLLIGSLTTYLKSVAYKTFLIGILVILLVLTPPAWFPIQETQYANVKKTIEVISHDQALRGLGWENFDLYTVSESDRNNWDASIYWYLLEKRSDRKLAEIDFKSSKASKISKKDSAFLYVICHGIERLKVENTCIPNFVYQYFKIIDRIDLPKNTIFITRPV